MNEQVSGFIKANRIAVLSVMRPDGSIHAASIHYSCSLDMTEFYFATMKTTRKVAGLLARETQQAAMVIGFSEDEMKTFQADGSLQVITEGAELEKVKETHYSLHPFAQRFDGNPDTIFLKFTPSWWRYSEFKANPPVFIESE